MLKVSRQTFQAAFLMSMALNAVMALAQEPHLIINPPYNSLAKTEHYGEGPVWQEQMNELQFIADKGTLLDTPCRFRDEGQIEIAIPVTRVVGEVDANGNLIQAQQLIKSGLLSPTASLKMPIYDVDLPKEIDEVWFNGIHLGHSLGGDGIWELNRLEIPIELVKFPQRNPAGTPLQPAINTIIIQIDTTSTEPSWCTSVDWVALSFKAMSPVLVASEPTSDLTGQLTMEEIQNGDNLVDQLVVNVETNTIKAGNYRVFVQLETPQGQSLFRTTAATLTAGTGNIPVNFEAEALRKLGEPGPYQIKSIELIYYDEQGNLINSDQLSDVGSTPAYQLEQLEKLPFALMGQTTTQGIDEDGDGRFEKLRVSVAADIVNRGIYFWTLKLTDPTGKRIAIAAGAKFFSTPGINHLVVDFDGSAIGNSGVDGPYQLTDSIIQGPGTFEIVEAVGETPALLVRQFPFQAAPASCQLYAVHDEGLNQSQFFTVDLTNHQVNPLGTPYPGYDIEGLAIHPQTDQIYASSGNRVAPYRAKGHLYLVDGQTGQLFAIGSTGFEEVDSLAFDDTGTLWGWAKGAGLITIDTNTGEGHLELPSLIKVEDLTISNHTDPPLFYGAVQTDLWQYPPLEIICAGKLPHETEALEMLPDNRLLFGTHQDPTFSIHLLDLASCSVITDADIVTPFNDIEGIALPQNACIDY
jgi:hypothetical protein